MTYHMPSGSLEHQACVKDYVLQSASQEMLREPNYFLTIVILGCKKVEHFETGFPTDPSPASLTRTVG